VRPPVSDDRAMRPRSQGSSQFYNRILRHSHECSACRWIFFPTFRLLGFILFFHTGGSGAEWRASIRKFVDTRAAMAHVLQTLTDPNIAKLVGMYRHLVTLVYKKMFEENFGTPSVYRGARRSFYVFEKRDISGFSPDLVKKGSTVYLINLNDGNKLPMTAKKIDECLEHFYQMDLTSAINQFKNILNSFSICKRCILGVDENDLCFDYENNRFLLRSEQSGGPRRKRTRQNKLADDKQALV